MEDTAFSTKRLWEIIAVPYEGSVRLAAARNIVNGVAGEWRHGTKIPLYVYQRLSFGLSHKIWWEMRPTSEFWRWDPSLAGLLRYVQKYMYKDLTSWNLTDRELCFSVYLFKYRRKDCSKSVVRYPARTFQGQINRIRNEQWLKEVKNQYRSRT